MTNLEWIDIYVSVPDDGDLVLVTGFDYGSSTGKRWISLGARCCDGFWDDDIGNQLHRPTHWMPLPALPTINDCLIVEKGPRKMGHTP